MAQDLIQKNCPKCGLRAIRIERNKLGMRHCPDKECGTTWYPQKVKLEDAPNAPAPKEENENE